MSSTIYAVTDKPTNDNLELSPPCTASCVRYVVITPARNEEAGISEMVRGMVNQTLRPLEWVIVNDGSQDRTGQLLDQYAQQYPCITVVHRPDRGHRSPGGGVIEAFYDGYRNAKNRHWDFIVKLDADLALGERYFESCLNEFAHHPKLGVGGGLVYDMEGGRMRIDSTTMFHVRGATKIYRRACWDALGGLLIAPGWDTMDEVKANMLGWESRTFYHIPVTQRRPTGSQDGAWRDYVKNGSANYICGYHPLFMVGKCASRLFRQPLLIGSLALAYGFLKAFASRTPRVKDRALIAYLRRQQLRRLVGRESIWK